jgi:hypothetical protein
MATPEPWIAASRSDLLAGAQSTRVVDPGDARSGSVFEKVTIDGEPYFAKTLGYRTDWIMRNEAVPPARGIPHRAHQSQAARDPVLGAQRYVSSRRQEI